MPFHTNDLLAALPRLRRYARFLTEDPARADDMVEETLTRARHLQDELPSGTTPGVRLFSMLRTVYADQFAPGRPRGPLSPLPSRDFSPSAGTDSTGPATRSNVEPAEGLRAQLFRLPIDQREVLVLVAVERISYEEIAALLAVPVATVFARLVQAREGLRFIASEPLGAPKSAG
jgi:RNA polymerase sigma-70 factor (ECF subfamily)